LAHTAGDILIYIPKEKVLFTGDILETDYHPYLGDPESDIDRWIKVLDRIMELDVQMIIPGHGPISGKKEVVELKEYLEIFDVNAKRLATRYDDFCQILAELKKILPKRSEMGVVISANISDKYLKE
ncbi:MAG: MBL fold metallo-hydrolase, partial [Dehalococcoidia bacterium]